MHVDYSGQLRPARTVYCTIDGVMFNQIALCIKCCMITIRQHPAGLGGLSAETGYPGEAEPLPSIAVFLWQDEHFDQHDHPVRREHPCKSSRRFLPRSELKSGVRASSSPEQHVSSSYPVLLGDLLLDTKHPLYSINPMTPLPTRFLIAT